MLEKEFNPDKMYSKIVHYYIDKKGYAKSKANRIAQHVVRKETERRMCKADGCGHFAHDHLRNTGACLVSSCMCEAFTRSPEQSASDAGGDADADANLDEPVAATLQ